jgi:L-serine dehydratase
MRFTALDRYNQVLIDKTYFSIGGGFIAEDGVGDVHPVNESAAALPYPFSSAEEMLRMAARERLPISDLVLKNECARLGEMAAATAAATVNKRILHIWETMRGCMQRGMMADGILPGGLKVRRRARRLADRLRDRASSGDPLAPLDWVTVYAMAVNEENAAGGRVVTAPTNGAAGVIPAVAEYYLKFVKGASEEGFFIKRTLRSPARRWAARAR